MPLSLNLLNVKKKDLDPESNDKCRVNKKQYDHQKKREEDLNPNSVDSDCKFSMF